MLFRSNSGLSRGSVRFNRIRDPDTNEDIKTLKVSKPTLIDFEFISDYNVINKGERFLFRSGRVNGIGKIL